MFEISVSPRVRRVLAWRKAPNLSGGDMADDQVGDNTQKDPDRWVTGDEPMTGAQASYLRTLSEEANESFDEGLSKADASKRIEELQAKTGRGSAP
jgi:hypothetical protein